MNQEGISARKKRTVILRRLYEALSHMSPKKGEKIEIPDPIKDRIKNLDKQRRMLRDVGSQLPDKPLEDMYYLTVRFPISKPNPIRDDIISQSQIDKLKDFKLEPHMPRKARRPVKLKLRE